MNAVNIFIIIFKLMIVYKKILIIFCIKMVDFVHYTLKILQIQINVSVQYLLLLYIIMICKFINLEIK